MRCAIYFFLFLSSLVAAPFAGALAEVQRFRLSPDESQIITKITDPFGNVVNGTLRLRQGEARGDIDRLQETGSVSLVIEASSYNSNLGLRDQDVQEYYLEVQQYPVIRLDSTGIENAKRPQSPQGPWRMTLRATLDLHGVRREVIVPLQLVYQSNRIVAQGSFQLLLDHFKIKVPRLLFFKAENRVQVDFRIVGEHHP